MSNEKETSDPTPADTGVEKKAKPGASWKANEEHVLPPNNIPVVFTGLMCCTFLAALDQVRDVQPRDLLACATHAMIDHRRHSSAHHRREVRRRLKLQLGRQVRAR